MNWRTDKPTADRIVAQISKCSLHTGGYIVLELKQRPKPHYVDCNGVDVPEYAFIKWADLEEDETVTDCDDLEEEIKRYNRELWDRDTTLSNVARHFAKWGAEHTFTHHETDESLQEAVTHQMEDEQVIDDYVRKGLDEVCLRYAELGAKWGAEHRDRFLNWIRDLIKAGIEKPEEALNILKRIDTLINDNSLWAEHLKK